MIETGLEKIRHERNERNRNGTRMKQEQEKSDGSEAGTDWEGDRNETGMELIENRNRRNET